MAPRPRPLNKRKSEPLTAEKMQRMVARALARNGDNTILLNMAQDIGEIKAGVATIQGRLGVIEPTLWKLEAKRIEGEGQRKLIGGVLRLRHAVYAAITGGLAYLGFNWPKVP
jgi:hypothetical protein